MRRPSPALPRPLARRWGATLGRTMAGALAGALAGAMAGALSIGVLGAAVAVHAGDPAGRADDVTLVASSNPVTPGNFTGYAFDQCNTVTESAMQTWRRSSPFQGVGVYISGDSRACKTQANLTPTWVRNQLAAGWRLLPITLGPQASCSARFPRYGARVDPTIDPSPANGYAAARSQGAAEAQDAVAAATRLGIVAGSTIFYDLEAWNLKHSTDCTQSALWFTHAWTVELHRLGYASGFYSSAASGLRMLDDERVRPGTTATLPDQVWIADWDGKANTSSTYIRSDGWQPYSRVKQYRGGHDETHGGVTINIDSNYLSLRTPVLPGRNPAPTPSPTPSPTPAPAPTPVAGGPRYTGAAMNDPRCSPATINRPSYRRTGSRTGSGAIVPLQCVLKQNKLYPYEVTGRWNPQTRAALRTFQSSVEHPQREFASRSDMISLLVRGTARTPLRTGRAHPDTIRLQRALNAATPTGRNVTGTWRQADVLALKRYQRAVRLKATGVPNAATWSALQRGLW